MNAKNRYVSDYAPLESRLDNSCEDAWLYIVEAYVMQKSIEKHRYNQTETAEALGISRGQLRTKLKSYFGNKYIGGHLKGDRND